jgi:lactobin A/cerein 7B family class IIb bacteriocin
MTTDENEIRELTQDELMSVTGGMLHVVVHLARTAAVIAALGYLVLDEAGAIDAIMADANPY